MNIAEILAEKIREDYRSKNFDKEYYIDEYDEWYSDSERKKYFETHFTQTEEYINEWINNITGQIMDVRIDELYLKKGDTIRIIFHVPYFKHCKKQLELTTLILNSVFNNYKFSYTHKDSGMNSDFLAYIEYKKK